MHPSTQDNAADTIRWYAPHVMSPSRMNMKMSMDHPFSQYPFALALNQLMKQKCFSQESLAGLIRVSRERVNRVCTGTQEPSLQFVVASAYALCLAPHEARAFFSAAGYDLDSPHPKFSQIRAAIDIPHDLSNPGKTKDALDQLAKFGLAPEDKDGC